MRVIHSTKNGSIIACDSLVYLSTLPDESVDLIITSPPYSLTLPRSYGNASKDQYVNWFLPFGREFLRVLKPTGSFVLNIAPLWTDNKPTNSLVHIDLLYALVKDVGFHLCQELYWFNPNKVPSPSYATVQKIRLKQSVEYLYWFSPTPYPKADNRKVMQPLSEASKEKLKRGVTVSSKRSPSTYPSGGVLREHQTGVIQSAMLTMPNHECQPEYSTYCKEQLLPIHPARFPAMLPEFFIRFLTDEGDMVLDPFAGSCVTGAAAERLGRQWVCLDQDEQYLMGAVGRFTGPIREPKPSVYRVLSPCQLKEGTA